MYFIQLCCHQLVIFDAMYDTFIVAYWWQLCMTKKHSLAFITGKLLWTLFPLVLLHVTYCLGWFTPSYKNIVGGTQSKKLEYHYTKWTHTLVNCFLKPMGWLKQTWNLTLSINLLGFEQLHRKACQSILTINHNSLSKVVHIYVRYHYWCIWQTIINQSSRLLYHVNYCFAHFEDSNVVWISPISPSCILKY